MNSSTRENMYLSHIRQWRWMRAICTNHGTNSSIETVYQDAINPCFDWPFSKRRSGWFCSCGVSALQGFDDFDLAEAERTNKEDEYPSVKNSEKENIPMNMNISPSPVLSTIDSNNSTRLDTRMLNTMEDWVSTPFCSALFFSQNRRSFSNEKLPRLIHWLPCLWSRNVRKLLDTSRCESMRS